MKLGTILATAAALLTLTANASSNKIIYGEDNRLDVYETANQLHVDLAKSTAAMISWSSIRNNGEESVITSGTLEERGICESERFSNQISAANCSGFLVAPDLLVTAGHCINNVRDCQGSAWVFDFAVKDDADFGNSLTVPTSSVYACKEIISRELSRSNNDDFALIRLERAVEDRTPLTVRTSGRVETGTELVVIGHPTGIPTKIADGAQVRSNNNSVYFSANLDTYGGNSGSAVFNAETGVVEGILVRGGTDYVYNSRGGCRVSNRVANDSGRGEDVTRITNIKALVDLLNQ
jgi:V8-like Glu-specific endopeptidase